MVLSGPLTVPRHNLRQCTIMVCSCVSTTTTCIFHSTQDPWPIDVTPCAFATNRQIEQNMHLTASHRHSPEVAAAVSYHEKEAYELQPEMKQAAKVSYSMVKYFAP